MSNNKKYFAIFRKRLMTLNVHKKQSDLKKEAKLKNLENENKIPENERFYCVDREIKECFIIDDNKNVVAYGSTIRLPKDSNSNKVSEFISLSRAVHALKTGRFRQTRFGTFRYTPNFDIDENTKNLISKIRLDKKEPINLEKINDFLNLLKK